MTKVFTIVPIDRNFCYIADRHPFFVDDYGQYKFTSLGDAVNALVEWGLGERKDVISYFSKGYIKLQERDDFNYINDMDLFN